MKSKTWPIVGIIQGLKSVANAVMRQRRATNARDRPYGADVGFSLHTSFERHAKNRPFSSRYERCTVVRSTGFLSGFLRTAPLCAEHHKLGRRPAGASSRHFNADVWCACQHVKGDGRRVE